MKQFSLLNKRFGCLVVWLFGCHGNIGGVGIRNRWGDIAFYIGDKIGFSFSARLSCKLRSNLGGYIRGCRI